MIRKLSSLTLYETLPVILMREVLELQSNQRNKLLTWQAMMERWVKLSRDIEGVWLKLVKIGKC